MKIYARTWTQSGTKFNCDDDEAAKNTYDKVYGTTCGNQESLISLGYNLLGNGTGCPTVGSDLTVDPVDVFFTVLGPLQANGGDTATHALLRGSPAIDAADDAACPATDQRGFGRPADGDGDGVAGCDVGAYEFPSTILYFPLVFNY